MAKRSRKWPGTAVAGRMAGPYPSKAREAIIRTPSSSMDGRRFTRAVITSTLEGHTLYRDALHLLSFKKVSTLNELASHLGIG